MLNNKYVVALIIIAVIVGLLIVTKANFGGHVGMGGTGASVQVGPHDSGDLNYFDSALMLGHSGTTRVQHLLRKGILKPGSKPKTITRASLEAYAATRRTAEAGYWYRIHLEDDQKYALERLLTDHLGPSVQLERLHHYDEAAKLRRRRRELRSAGVSSGSVSEDADDETLLGELHRLGEI